MWSSHALFLIVCSVSLSLGSCSHQHAWDSRHEYKYLVQSQTLTTMDDQQRTSGIAMKGVLIVNPQSAYTLHARIPKLQYVRVNEQGPHEFEAKISQMSNEKFDDVPISGKPFEIAVKHGVIRDIMVDSDVPVWEVNLLKGIVGQLQVDTQGENSISSSSNQIPDDEEQPFASYKVMEDSVGGNCEVYYDIVPLSEDLLNDQPDLVPLPHLDQENQKSNFIEVRKTKDYQKCKQRQAYRFNQFGSPSWPNSSPKPSWSNSKQNDELVSQVSTNHMVLSGNLKRFTIQSSVMKSNIFVKPRGQDSAIGTVSSKVNLTLVERHNASEPMQLRTTANQLVSTGNLVYMYNNPFSQSGVRPRQPSVSRNSQQAQSSESSSSSSSSSEESHKSPKTFGRNNQQDDSSSSSSSSEEVNDNFLQPTPRLNEAPNNPFLPLFIGINGKSIHSSDKTDAVQLAASLAIQVVEGVQDPNVQEPDQTLEKFTMLQNLLRTMNTKQLIEVEQHVLESSKQNAKSDRWANIKEILYQIITQIGTGPALECIKKWIENKFLQGLDAAFIVSRIPKTCLTPTPQYVRAFYELISSPEVKNQNYLKVSGPIALAELLRNAQNNKKNYPVHSFGDMKIPNEDVREYISYLAQELKKAIEENNVTLIQTYIVALGYTAHPKVIEVFEPYLEGRQPVSTFQRLMMVNALSPLTATSPKFVRSVLYKIYSNIQEADEIRAAAFYNVIKSKPSLLTMIRMAQFTNYDQSDQVNSAVVTTINSLSRLTQWQALDMALKGRIAKRFLTHKRFHVANSRGHYADSTKNNDPVQRYYLETIQGHKTLPKYAHFEVDVENDNLDAFGMKFEYGMSNIQQLLQYYHQSFPENKQEGQKKSPAEKLVRALNIQPNDVEQFEGYLLTATTNEMQFYPFDKNVLQNLFENLKEHAQKHQQLNVNRLQNRDTAVSLSTESGLPFAYTIQRPILHQIEATNAETENNKHSKIAKGTVNMLFASRIENRFGFTTPFEHQQYIGGIDRDYHVNVPMELKVETQPDKHQICLELKVNSKSSQQLKNQNQQVMHMSTVPFVTRHDILDVQPLHHNRNSQIAFASARSGVSQHRASYGAGVITVEMEFDKEAAETMNNRNIMKLLSPSNENDVHYKKVDVFLDSNAARRGIRLNIAHAKSSSDNANQQSEAPTSQTFTVIDGQPNSEARRQQFLTELNKAIQPADNNVWDVDVEYPTLQKQIRQVLTVGVGHNNVDEKYRTLVYWNTQSAADGNINYEALGTGNMKLSQKTPLNIENVLNREQQNNFDFNLQYGKKYSNGEKMHVNGNMLQSNDLRDKIKDSETVKLCQEESKQGKKGSQACQRAAVLARMKDRVKISTHVDPARHTSIVEKLINIISIVFGAEVVSVNQRQTGKSTIDIELKSSPSHDQADISISSSDIELTLSLHDPSHNAQSSLQTSSQLISQLPQLATEMSSQSSSGLSWQLASELLLQLPQLATEMSSQSSSGLSWQLASKLSQLSSRLPSQWSSKLLSLKKQVELAAQTPAEPASCTVGRNYVITFDSAYYYLNDPDLWQVVFIPDPKSNSKLPNDEYIHLPKDSDVAILSREKDGEIQIRLYFGDKEVQFEKVNDNIRVSVDGRLGREYKKQNKQDITVYQDKQNGEIYMQIYELQDRSIKLHSGKYGIFAVYDGQHILLHAYDKYRNAIHGLCGNYDDEPANDIRSPNNCVEQKSEKLSAMYTLIEDGQQGFTAKNKYNDTCVKNPHYQSNVISDVEAGRPPTASNWGYHSNTSYGRRPRVKGNKKSPKNSSNKNKNIPEVEHTNEYDPDQNPNQKPNKKNRTPLQYRTRVDEKHNEICFSIRPLPQCDQNSEPVETKVKTYAFYCTEKNQVVETRRGDVSKHLSTFRYFIRNKMIAFKRDKKEEEDGGGNPFQNLEKTTVLQEARTFNNTPVNPRKCAHILTKILYLLNQGEQLGTMEATEAFFAMTKLFQSRDVILRRLVYLGIKELSSLAEDVIIVTSSLTKDMTGKEDLYRAAAIRALCTITDSSMLAAIERYMKQAIVDRSPAVSSAALVSSLHLTSVSGDVARRWANEAQEALNSNNVMVQYHALGVLYQARKTDKHAVIKLVAKLMKTSPKSPYAACMLIRMAYKLLDEVDEGEELIGFIESCLRHKSEMVVYEAAHALVNLGRSGAREIGPAISVLQLFCGSPKPALRFAAVRTLNKVAMSHPAAVTACNLDLENLITDSNRSIATLAITTLLKTGAESSVDRLMKQIATFVSEISDEFKVVVVQAIRALCQKFPRKHAVLMNFLSAMLRDEGGLEYKAAIADTIIAVMEGNAEAKEAGLAHLCEFIEDCEHISLAVRILHLLGQEGPTSKQPSRYIRFIYNRVILESASVRAAAVTALARFAAACPPLLPNVLVLLSRCQLDSDDEVRDRAAYYCTILQQQNDPTMLPLVQPPALSVPTLERALRNYMQTPMEELFDISQIPPAQTIEEPAQVEVHTTIKQPRLTREESFMEKLSQIPHLAIIIRDTSLLKSSSVFELTESETEYNVKCIKHTFPEYLILQFDCVNTLSDQLLEDVVVAVEPSEGYSVVCMVPCPRLPYNEPGTTYTVLKYPEDVHASVATIPTTLRFMARDCDPTTGIPDADQGYRDEYMLEDLEVTLADQVRGVGNRGVDFNTAWDTYAAKGFVKLEETFALGASVTSLEGAIQSLTGFLGLEAVERSNKVQSGAAAHNLLLSGVFRGGREVLARARLALNGTQVTMQLSVLCQDPDVADLIVSSVG